MLFSYTSSFLCSGGTIGGASLGKEKMRKELKEKFNSCQKIKKGKVEEMKRMTNLG
jgi:hypothetical protein